jgi:cysteine desulfurase/selenocysteine lyase
MKHSLSVKKDFPLFESHPQLSYLDSTATSLKPQVVIDALDEYYSEYSANVHRGIYDISEKATEMFEQARQTVADFIGGSPEEVVFTRGSTEGLNLLCSSLGKSMINSGDEIVTTIIEHHSNFVPWQQLAQEQAAILKVALVNKKGIVDVLPLITKRTKILALTALSNVLGVALPVEQISMASVPKMAKSAAPARVPAFTTVV